MKCQSATKKKRKPKKKTKKQNTGSETGQEKFNYILKTNGPLRKSESSKLKAVVNFTTSSELVAAAVLSIPRMKAEILNQLFRTMNKRAKFMGRRKHGDLSVLIKKQRKDLENFNTSDIVGEMLLIFPELVLLLVHMMLPENNLNEQDKIDKIMKKLATVRAIVMQTKNIELSAMQRVVSL